jgi:hypothetical protein
LFSQPNRCYKITFADTIPGFTSISATGNIVISIRQDNFFSITFRGSKVVLKDVFSSIKVDNHCLKIDAGKIEEQELIFVDIIMPVVDSLYLYDNACVNTPTNLWLKKLYIENYSEKKSTIYINSNDCKITMKGQGEISLAGIIDALNLNVEGKIKTKVEVISKFVKIKASEETVCNLSGKSFQSEYYSLDNAVIDASLFVNGKAKALAKDKSKIQLKSEDNPILVSLDKGKVFYNSPVPIIPDSSGVKNLKEKIK